jgi:chaperonin GroEL
MIHQEINKRRDKSMAKKIVTGEEARRESVNALENIAEYVSSTLGPSGRPILMTKRGSSEQAPVSVTKDGYNCLQALAYDEPVTDAVLQIAKQSAGRSVYASGDGTTSTITMAAAFARAIHESANHKNPQAAIRAYRKEVARAIEAISKEAVLTAEATSSVVLTSANHDTEMRDAAIDALSKTSHYGSIMILSSPTSNKKYNVDKDFGYQCGAGYNYSTTMACSLDPAANTNEDVVLNKPYVMPFNGDIFDWDLQIIPVVQKLHSMLNTTEYSLLVVAHDVTEETAQRCAEFNRSNAHNNLKVALIKNYITIEINGMVEQLKDISAFSGSEIHDGGTLSSLNPEGLGQIGSARIQTNKTFLNGRGKKHWINKRAEENKITAGKADSPVDKDNIEARNSSLTGGLVKLTVGGALFSELSEIKDRMDDAVRAGQSCNRSGALPGCGVSYIRAGKLAGVSEPIQNALGSIHNKILENYGMEDQFVDSHEKGKTVFVSDDEIKIGVDFLECGVADSFETVKGVMLNAFELGAVIANIGAVCLESDLELISKMKLGRTFLPK